MYSLLNSLLGTPSRVLGTFGWPFLSLVRF
jgi:hypothetical protein